MSTTSAWVNPLRNAKDKRLPRIAGPSGMVIFGVTGDLARKKLMPAVYDLANRGLLPPSFALVGFARRDWTDEDYEESAHELFADSPFLGEDPEQQHRPLVGRQGRAEPVHVRGAHPHEDVVLHVAAAALVETPGFRISIASSVVPRFQRRTRTASTVTTRRRREDRRTRLRATASTSAAGAGRSAVTTRAPAAGGPPR